MTHTRLLATPLLLAFCALAALAQGPPATPDLAVTFIEMTPKYPAYQVEYDPGGLNPRLSQESAAHDKRWPDAGEEMTLTAHITNQGGAGSGSFEVQWVLDGEPYGQPLSVGGLPPGGEITLETTWPWEDAQHEMGLTVDTGEAIDEIAEHNNTHTIHTHALNLIMVCDPATYQGFAEVPNLLGTYSWEDWANAHIDYMNQMFENAIYPVTPNGCRERVRVDRIVIATQEEWEQEINPADNRIQFQGHDGGWFYVMPGAYGERASVIDWGLIHELGHQLGLIDEYQFDVAWENNRAPDPAGDPVLIGYYGSTVDSMMHGHGPVPFSDFAAIHLESQLHRRRGFYGDVQFNVPLRNEVRVLDREGRPVAGAVLSFHQKADGYRVPADPVFTLTTDERGMAELPNRDIGVEPYSPVGTNYLYRDNPFGPIGIVGGNNVFFIRIEARGHTEYQWMDIMEFVRAFFTGNQDHWLKPLQTRIPTNELLEAPTGVQATREGGGGVRVTWEPSPSPMVVRYHVYRAVPPYFEWERAGFVRAPEAEFIDAEPPAAPLLRYMVTAMDPGEHESAFSRWFAVPMLREPGGLAVLPDGRLLLADHGQNQLLWLRSDLSVIGPFNSVHHHLHPHDVAVSEDGLVVVTDLPDGYDPRASLRFMTPEEATREHTSIPPLGKPQGTREPHPDEPFRLDGPTGVFADSEGYLVTDQPTDRVIAYSPERDMQWVLRDLIDPARAVRLDDGRVAIAETGRDRVLIATMEDGELAAATEIVGFTEPRYVMPERDGASLYVADTGGGRVVQVTAEGEPLGEWVADTSGMPLDRPTGLALGADGQLYVVDAGAMPRVALVEPGA
jgi:hypothetical protein